MALALIRVRGVHGIKKGIAQAMDELSLTRKNHCVIVEKAEKSVLQKIRDFVTWGEVSPQTVSALEKAKGKQKVFRLNNPTGGWKGVKNHFPKGDLGYRGDKINDLIMKMLH
jgi:large subunit ribosomal protein L30